ncbi:ATP-binding protein [Sphingomonas sp.]|uniref:ATP-binding protein n=1 Tax=Sphingomonas sp. TaxID=28214 RepID=UPI001B22326D|nr:ATP-binding protein [Sphingomonas sp.]MBO9715113.1 HAMP domain-containing histidine kinase [Sphingomonas sp.]
MNPIDPSKWGPGRRNLWLLIQFRWIAVGGQLATIAAVDRMLGIRLPLVPLLLAPIALMAINFVSLPLLRRKGAVTNEVITGALLLDVAALAWQLHFTGGLANPFASLFLLHVVLGAMLLKPWSSWAIVGAAGLGLIAAAIDPVPLAIPERYHSPFNLYLTGSLICFALIAILLVLFVTRISRNLRDRDAALAASRQRAAEEDHIVRMGLLASGAAHELGTPLASVSVILGDWQRMPRLSGDADLAQDIIDMQAEIARCKTILSGILMSAGEARGEAPEFTTMRTFLDGIVAEWRASRAPAEVDYSDQFGPDVAIVSDPALRQVIGNVIDNAAEVSPAWIGITAARAGDALVLEVADKGPGFAPEMLGGFGQPYRSTKGRPGGGLGLFLLVNVLRKLGGGAVAYNRVAGGALVRITLPLDAIARPG